MASGMPVVCTELGTGTSYVNINGVTGLVVPPADAAALATAINHLLGDDNLRYQMGEQARIRARQEFSEQRMLERIEEIYRQITSQ
jgi:rhamnosyl/mannosyltransferase